VFNVGQLRRSQAKAEFEACAPSILKWDIHADLASGKGKADHSAKYFSHSDEEASKVREKLAEESLESLISWLKAEGNVGIMGKLFANQSIADIFRRDK
jgi:6-phosphofructo-2-kinase/fructose-2,6-biphosphatase 2